MLKGGKLLIGCVMGLIAVIFGFTVIFTLVVEARRQHLPFGKDIVADWMLGTPQPVDSEFSDNGYTNAGVGVGWEDYTHLGDPSKPRGIPFDFKARLGCEFKDPNYSHHTGVDFPHPIGTPVYATMAGLVVYTGPNGDWGNLVVVENNGYQTYFAHLNSMAVGKGQVISRGQSIGAVGNNGNSSGAHLHYGIKKRTGEKSAIWMDPEGFFNRSDTTEWPCGN